MFEDNDRYRRLRQEEPASRLSCVDYARPRQSREGPDGFFCRFTFGQFFALLILEVFTIFFVFYLGARYGQKLLGFEKDSPIVVGGRTTESEAKVLSTSDPEVAAMADEIVEKAKTPELKERLAEMLKRPDQRTSAGADVKRVENTESAEESSLAAQNAAAPAAVQPQPAEAENTQPAEAAQNPAETPAQMPMRQAAPTSEVEKGAVRIKSAEGSKYALQVGSYQQMSEANSAVLKLKAKGYPAYLMIADIPDRGRWYRVRVGAFSSRSEANKYKQQFDSQEAVDTIVVMNEQ
jgi:cell division septation protein DedD